MGSESRHEPNTHTSCASHSWPHSPQLKGSSSRLEQSPAQSVSSPQSDSHEKSRHTSSHSIPHSPQCVASVRSTTQLPSQRSVPSRHSQRSSTQISNAGSHSQLNTHSPSSSSVSGRRHTRTPKAATNSRRHASLVEELTTDRLQRRRRAGERFGRNLECEQLVALDVGRAVAVGRGAHRGEARPHRIFRERPGQRDRPLEELLHHVAVVPRSDLLQARRGGRPLALRSGIVGRIFGRHPVVPTIGVGGGAAAPVTTPGEGDQRAQGDASCVAPTHGTPMPGPLQGATDDLRFFTQTTRQRRPSRLAPPPTEW